MLFPCCLQTPLGRIWAKIHEAHPLAHIHIHMAAALHRSLTSALLACPVCIQGGLLLFLVSLATQQAYHQPQVCPQNCTHFATGWLASWVGPWMGLRILSPVLEHLSLSHECSCMLLHVACCAGQLLSAMFNSASVRAYASTQRTLLRRHMSHGYLRTLVASTVALCDFAVRR